MAIPTNQEETKFENNMTPMIDIIFQLLIFFMCATKFRILEGKLMSYLPKDKGLESTPVVDPVIEEVRIVLTYDDNSGITTIKVGETVLPNEAEMIRIVAGLYNEYRNLGKKAPVIIDAKPNVPLRDVVFCLNTCQKAKIEGVEFAAPPPDDPPAK